MPRIGAFNFADDTPPPVRQEAPAPAPAPAPAHPPQPRQDPAALLEQVVASSRTVAKPQKFVAGRRPEPKSGMTAAQMLRDPETLDKLGAEIAKWEAENPNRKLLGPAVKGILPHVSDAQARTIAKKLNAERTRMVVGRSSDDGRAAAAAMKKG